MMIIIMILFNDITAVAANRHRIELFFNHHRLHHSQNKQTAMDLIPKHRRQTEETAPMKQAPFRPTVLTHDSFHTHEVTHEVFTFYAVPTSRKYVLGNPKSSLLSALLYQLTSDHQYIYF